MRLVTIIHINCNHYFTFSRRVPITSENLLVSVNPVCGQCYTAFSNNLFFFLKAFDLPCKLCEDL